MAGEVQLAPLPRSQFYGCPSAPSLLVKLQDLLLPLGFLLCVRGSGEAAIQLPLPWYQHKRSWCTKPNLATWKVQGYSAHLCKQCGMGQEEGGLLEGQISYRLWASPEFNP